jgi:hypothetical protein
LETVNLHQDIDEGPVSHGYYKGTGEDRDGGFGTGAPPEASIPAGLIMLFRWPAGDGQELGGRERVEVEHLRPGELSGADLVKPEDRGVEPNTTDFRCFRSPGVLR